MNSILTFCIPAAILVSTIMQQQSARKSMRQGDEIHRLVNSEMTKALERIDRLQKELAALKLKIKGK